MSIYAELVPRVEQSKYYLVDDEDIPSSFVAVPSPEPALVKKERGSDDKDIFSLINAIRKQVTDNAQWTRERISFLENEISSTRKLQSDLSAKVDLLLKQTPAECQKLNGKLDASIRENEILMKEFNAKNEARWEEAESNLILVNDALKARLKDSHKSTATLTVPFAPTPKEAEISINQSPLNLHFLNSFASPPGSPTYPSQAFIVPAKLKVSVSHLDSSDSVVMDTPPSEDMAVSSKSLQAHIPGTPSQGDEQEEESEGAQAYEDEEEREQEQFTTQYQRTEGEVEADEELPNNNEGPSAEINTSNQNYNPVDSNHDLEDSPVAHKLSTQSITMTITTQTANLDNPSATMEGARGEASNTLGESDMEEAMHYKTTETDQIRKLHEVESNIGDDAISEDLASDGEPPCEVEALPEVASTQINPIEEGGEIDTNVANGADTEGVHNNYSTGGAIHAYNINEDSSKRKRQDHDESSKTPRLASPQPRVQCSEPNKAIENDDKHKRRPHDSNARATIGHSESSSDSLKHDQPEKKRTKFDYHPSKHAQEKPNHSNRDNHDKHDKYKQDKHGNDKHSRNSDNHDRRDQQEKKDKHKKPTKPDTHYKSPHDLHDKRDKLGKKETNSVTSKPQQDGNHLAKKSVESNGNPSKNFVTEHDTSKNNPSNSLNNNTQFKKYNKLVQDHLDKHNKGRAPKNMKPPSDDTEEEIDDEDDEDYVHEAKVKESEADLVVHASVKTDKYKPDKDYHNILESYISIMPLVTTTLKDNIKLARRDKVVVTFSRNKGPTEEETLRDLVAKVEALGGSHSKELRDEVTHLIVFPNQHRSAKKVYACIQGQWLMGPDWIEASAKEGQWKDEIECGGKRRQRRVLQEKWLYIPADFASNAREKAEHAKDLMEFGDGGITTDSAQADFILAPQTNKALKHISWVDFLNVVMQSIGN